MNNSRSFIEGRRLFICRPDLLVFLPVTADQEPDYKCNEGKSNSSTNGVSYDSALADRVVVVVEAGVGRG